MRAGTLLIAIGGLFAIALLLLIGLRGGNSYVIAAMALVMVLAAVSHAYGARLADRDHAREPDRFKPFTGTSNIPIFTALWRAAKAGNKAAKWAMVAVYGCPFAALFIIFAPGILRKIGF
ncbi:MAG: hypothetical protein JNK47_17040 [Mesorhizobium sp.]|nr:hypothetical protein [Mesorhizobium sp.]MBL8578928.1 hypothetical protein [Mesorhizobium sp.]